MVPLGRPYFAARNDEADISLSEVHLCETLIRPYGNRGAAHGPGPAPMEAHMPIAS